MGYETNSVEPIDGIKVRLLGRDYSVRGHGNKEYISKIADFINTRADEIRKNTKIVSTMDILILTLLNITDEMFQLQQVMERTKTGSGQCVNSTESKDASV